jgi:hypothetical protein
VTQREDQKSAIPTAPHSLDSKIEFVQCDSRPSEDFAFVGASLFSAPGQVAYATVGTETWIILNTDADTDGESLIRVAGTQPVDASWFSL